MDFPRQTCNAFTQPLINEYFGVQPSERLLIADTVNVIIPSVQPTRSRVSVPTMTAVADEVLVEYKDRLCETLGQWSGKTNNLVGRIARSRKLGIAMTIIERTDGKKSSKASDAIDDMDVLALIERLQKALPRTRRVVDFVRGLMVFHGPILYIVKPDTWRHWTQTAALNDADEIAGKLLSYPAEAHS